MDNPNFKKFQKKKGDESSVREKKVESVVSGATKVKKKSEVRKITDVFVSEDISNVKSYVLMDVLVPAIKKAISDIVTNGIDMILYGETGKSRKTSPGSHIQYGGFYRGSDERRDRSVGRVSNGLDFNDVVFDNRGDAEAVLQAMDDIIEQFGVVSVGDFYDLAQISTNNYAINKYGWTDIRGANVVRVRDGYMIKLPRPLLLN